MSICMPILEPTFICMPGLITCIINLLNLINSLSCSGPLMASINFATALHVPSFQYLFADRHNKKHELCARRAYPGLHAFSPKQMYIDRIFQSCQYKT